MKQPILFKTRAIDLSEILEEMNPDVIDRMSLSYTRSDAQFIEHYFCVADTEDTEHLVYYMKDKHGIDLTELNYGFLPVPYAVDMLKGEAYPAMSIDYTLHSQRLSSAMVRKDDKAQILYDVSVPYDIEGREKTELKILHDGWL